MNPMLLIVLIKDVRFSFFITHILAIMLILWCGRCRMQKMMTSWKKAIKCMLILKTIQMFMQEKRKSKEIRQKNIYIFISMCDFILIYLSTNLQYFNLFINHSVRLFNNFFSIPFALIELIACSVTLNIAFDCIYSTYYTWVTNTFSKYIKDQIIKFPTLQRRRSMCKI